MEPQKRASSQTTSWENSFPAEIEKESNSVLLVHRFIKIASSFILDKRGILEKQGDKFFKTRTIEKLLIPMFDKDNAKAKLLIKKIDSLKAAIEKKYLREFAIVFYQRPNEEDTIEVFSFRLMYGSEGNINLALNSKIGSEESDQNLLQATFTDLNTTKLNFCDTIRKLHRCIKQLDNLPTDADASFRISFTENKPEDYMPEGYDTSLSFYELNNEIQKGPLGILCGGHNRVQLLAASQLWKEGAVDLNQTVNSIQSIIVKSAKKPTKGAQKKTNRAETRSPYAKGSLMNKRDAGAPPA
ncbi:CBN-HIM-3 protein [Caenorhabditis brenneri]|uniref:CBN-HIM-3 protein n=1 Tax=Caenorhabditis brenneri TaxID=135651 RepID=G0NY03_CAEBE|nr:CBN-HIM-3 protein [Caenorhabditis brenneri]